MRHFFLIGLVFCAAALFGMGTALFLPATADAGECHENERQTKCIDPWGGCSEPFSAGQWDCGTYYPGGTYCDCYWKGCYLGCPEPI
jgi:hypothetical protein